jgi:hypothetical protein
VEHFALFVLILLWSYGIVLQVSFWSSVACFILPPVGIGAAIQHIVGMLT